MSSSTAISCSCPICVYDLDFILDIANSVKDYSEEFKLNGVDREFVEDWSITGRRPFQKPKKSKPKTAALYCVFCKNNGLSEAEYSSHSIRDDKGICQCPVLRKYKCPICKKVGGDSGHTMRYCPKNKSNRDKAIQEAVSASSYVSTDALTTLKKRLSPIGKPVQFL